MTLHIFLMIAIMALVVILLRFFPFIVFPSGKNVPKIVMYLGRTITAAAIAMLVVYSFYGSLDWMNSGPARLTAGFLASLLTVLLQFFLKNPLVSIVGGTVLFMFLIR